MNMSEQKQKQLTSSSNLTYIQLGLVYYVCYASRYQVPLYLQNIVFKIVGTKFHLRQIILIYFWIKYVQNGYLQSNKEKMIITIEFSIFAIVMAQNSSKTDNFKFLNRICSKGNF